MSKLKSFFYYNIACFPAVYVNCFCTKSNLHMTTNIYILQHISQSTVHSIIQTHCACIILYYIVLFTLLSISYSQLSSPCWLLCFNILLQYWELAPINRLKSRNLFSIPYISVMVSTCVIYCSKCVSMWISLPEIIYVSNIIQMTKSWKWKELNEEGA